MLIWSGWTFIVFFLIVAAAGSFCSCGQSGSVVMEADDMTQAGDPAAPRVLFVVSAATAMDFANGETFSTGYWGPEFAVPYRALLERGFEIDVATPGGRVPTPDPISTGEGKRAVALQAYLDGNSSLRKPLVLAEIDDARAATYRAIVLPGGFAPMADLADSPAMARLLETAAEHEILVAAICHAPAALLSVRRPGKPWPYAGYRMVAFTNAEEQAWRGEKKLAWQVEDRLREAGAKFEHGGVWASHVVLDRNLLTGQNSPSCAEFTRVLLEELE